MLTDAQAHLGAARCRVLIKDPWYGAIASRFVWVEKEQVGTMGVQIMHLGKVICYYSPSFILGLTVDALIAVIKHEIEHIIRLHIPRGAAITDCHKFEIWNIATDWVINGCGDDKSNNEKHRKRIEDLPDCGVFIPTAKSPGIWSHCDLTSLDIDSTAEEFYDWLLKNTKSKIDDYGGTSVLSIFPCGSKVPLCVRGLDNHSIWKDSTASADEIRNVARDLARVASQHAGKAPGHLVEDIQRLQSPQHNWAYILRGFVGRHLGGRRWTHSRRHRKNDQFGIKGYSKRNNVLLTVFVDISGSVSQKMIQRFFGEIERQSHQFKITLITFDHVVQSVCDYHKGDWKKIQLKGRGGTSFINALNYAEENHLVGVVNIMFTDGFAEIPEPRPYNFIWVVVGSAGVKYLNAHNIWGHVVSIKHDYDD